ncbi:MAG: spondin domain-containing protein [Gaiellaceae bacterium]
MRNQASFEQLFEESDDPAFVIDPVQNRILAANRAGCELFGFTREELLATPISHIHPADLPQLRDFVERVLRDGCHRRGREQRARGVRPREARRRAHVFTGAGGPIPSGTARTFTIQTRGKFNRLTIVSMLVNTNDAFTGLDSVQVRGKRSQLSRNAYDAGSERNNELKAFIPGPCCGNAFVRDPEAALIGPHQGITGVGDLDPAVYGWKGPVAQITIERVS